MKRIGIYLLAVLLLAGAIGCSKASASQPVQAEASEQDMQPEEAFAPEPDKEPVQAASHSAERD